ncbi:hypothetical protein ALCH109712_09425 [Alkalicoccus chagannorensis]
MCAWIWCGAVTRGAGSDAARPGAVARRERAVARGGKAVTAVLGGHSGGRSGRSGAALGHSAPRSGALADRTGDVIGNLKTVNDPSPSGLRLPGQPRKLRKKASDVLEEVEIAHFSGRTKAPFFSSTTCGASCSDQKVSRAFVCSKVYVWVKRGAASFRSPFGSGVLVEPVTDVQR